MKRRPFLASLSTIGASSLLSLPMAGKTNIEENANTNDLRITETDTTPSILKKLENEFITFAWYDNASAEIIDKTSNTRWYMGPVALQEDEAIDKSHVWVRQERSSVEQYPGRFRGQLVENGIRFSVFNGLKQVKGTFLCDVSLESRWLSFKIIKIDESLQNLMFPTPLENDSIVLPMGVGRIIKKPLRSRFFHTFFSHLNMRFFGGLQGNNGYMAIFEDNFEDAGIMCSQMAVNPVWQKTLGKWAGTKTIKYTFVQGGYISMAKTYRKWAIDKGIFKTLLEKIKETPALKNVIGGRILSFYQAYPTQDKIKAEEKLTYKSSEKPDGKLHIAYTHKDTLQIIREMQTMGAKKGLINIRGWINGGYDYSHPDIWPPEPSLGTIEELKTICGIKDPFVTVLHDNYQDIYTQNPSWPKGVTYNKKNAPMEGGYWAGGQSYIINSKNSLEYAKRNWDKIKSLQVRGMFIDTTTAMQLYESYEQGNTLTRAQDLQYKSELLKFYKEQHQVLGSEESADFGIPYVDWLENRHKRVAGESIPIWPLVFHDCVINARYIDPTNVASDKNYFLEDMLWGYCILFRAGGKKENDWQKQKDEFKSTLKVDDWFGQIGTTEMTSHAFLSDDYQLEQTTFSNGKSIIVNFSNEHKLYEGQYIHSNDFIIKG